MSGESKNCGERRPAVEDMVQAASVGLLNRRAGPPEHATSVTPRRSVQRLFRAGLKKRHPGLYADTLVLDDEAVSRGPLRSSWLATFRS